MFLAQLENNHMLSFVYVFQAKQEIYFSFFIYQKEAKSYLPGEEEEEEEEDDDEDDEYESRSWRRWRCRHLSFPAPRVADYFFFLFSAHSDKTTRNPHEEESRGPMFSLRFPRLNT